MNKQSSIDLLIEKLTPFGKDFHRHYNKKFYKDLIVVAKKLYKNEIRKSFNNGKNKNSKEIDEPEYQVIKALINLINKYPNESDTSIANELKNWIDCAYISERQCELEEAEKVLGVRKNIYRIDNVLKIYTK